MRDCGPDEVHVPFVWVPNGARRPTEWLAQHPDAFWVPATLVQDRPQTAESTEATEQALSPDRIVHSYRPIEPRRKRSTGVPPDPNWQQEEPVAAFLRMNQMLDRLTGGAMARSDDALAPLPARSEQHGDFWFPAFAGMTVLGQCYRRLA